MLEQTIVEECASTIVTSFKSLCIVGLKSRVVVGLHTSSFTLIVERDIFYFLRRLWQRFSLFQWLLSLLSLKLLLARLQVNIEACCAKLTPTNVAHERCGPLYNLGRRLACSDSTSASATATATTLLVLDEGFRVEGSTTAIAFF